MPEPLLRVEDLRVEFASDGGIVQAVSGVSFEIQAGETLGIVGESGSGKSVSNLALLGLIPQPPGRIASGRAWFQGKDLLRLSQRELADIRGRKIAMIFQDPLTALNPLLTIEQQLTEVTRRHLGHTAAAARKHAVELLEKVGIPDPSSRIDSYPHQFSGGMRQRVMIAMALACRPDLLIADEPTTALDVTIQAQILDLLRELQQKHGVAVILITHDLGVVANVCQNVQVMYAGRIVEQAPVDVLFRNPRHPYTLGLLASLPRWDKRREKLTPISGQPPALIDLGPGCPFEPRCPYAEGKCRQADPPLQRRPEGTGAGRFACHVDVTQALAKRAGS